MTDDMSIYQTATKTKPRKIPDAIASNQGLILAKKIQSDRRVACGVWICGGRNLNAEKLSRKGKVDKSYSEPFFFLFFFAQTYVGWQEEFKEDFIASFKLSKDKRKH